MPYIGNSPANIGNYQIVDDISSGFDNVTTTFALTAASQTINPAKSGQLLVSINGVLQEPDDTGTEGFLVSGSNIVFSSAPATGSTFWCVFQGQNVDIGTPSNATVGTAQLSATGTPNTSTFLRGDNTWVIPTDTIYSHPTNHAISVVTGLQSALDGKVDDSQVLTNVPSGAVFTDTETTTTLSVAANVLTYTDEDGLATNIDLSLYLDDTNAAYIASGSLNGTTGVATFTRSDATSFDVNMSAFLDDTTVTVNNTLTSTSTTEALSAAQGKALNTRVLLNDAKTGITTAQASAITANTAKVSNVAHPLVETAVPVGALFTDTDTVYSHPATHPASMLTGALPAIDGSALTGIDALPAQTTHAGKYLGTDGTTATWNTLDTDANSTTKGLYEHANTISANYTIATGNNALTAGPITINTGVSVTVPTGSTWVVA